jgi:S1-C subfamily serine protease
MKKAILSSAIFATISVYSQVTIKVNPTTAKLAINSKVVSTPNKMNNNDMLSGAVAFLEGYCTNGIKGDKINNTSEYTILLNKQNKLPNDYKCKKIELVKLQDRTGKLSSPNAIPNTSGFISSFAGTNVSNEDFVRSVSDVMADRGFKMVGANSVFNTKADIPEFALAGVVEWFTKETKGKGFQVSIIVHWTLLNVSEENTVFEKTTGGYSDSQNSIGFNNELKLALKDALEGIMSDTLFQNIVAKKGNETKTIAKAEEIKISKPTPKKLTSYSEIVKESIHSVVTIKTNSGHGSGFLISNNGYVLTNNHVVSNSEKLEVMFDNGFSFDAVVVRTSSEKDVALLKISGNGFKAFVLNSDENMATVGTEVIAIGTPEDLSLGQSVTKGIVSGRREFDEKKYIQTDVTINSGNSGGPLINTSTGEVVGIVSRKVKEKGVEGLGFAIPIEVCIKELNLVFE